MLTAFAAALGAVVGVALALTAIAVLIARQILR